MADPLPPTTTYDCGLCLEQMINAPYYPAGSNRICPDCAKEHIVPRFLAALKFEAQYPVRWGDDVLDPDDFAAVLPSDYAQKLEEQEKEYLTPIKDRVYCKALNVLAYGETMRGIPPSRFRTYLEALDADPITAAGQMPSAEVCGGFVGARTKGRRFPRCPGCSFFSCSRCGTSFEERHPAGPCCTDEEADETVQRSRQPTNEYEGLTQGKDYQLCPNPACGLPIYLGDGCNHITCPSAACGTQFCFICSTEAEAESGHWDLGMPCPRFNSPGADNAIHDEVEDTANGDDSNSDDNESDLADLLPVDPEDLTERQRVWLFEGPNEVAHLPNDVGLVLTNLRVTYGQNHIWAIHNGNHNELYEFAADVFLALKMYFSPAFQNPLTAGNADELQRVTRQALNTATALYNSVAWQMLEGDVPATTHPVITAAIDTFADEHNAWYHTAQAALAAVGADVPVPPPTLGAMHGFAEDVMDTSGSDDGAEDRAA